MLCKSRHQRARETRIRTMREIEAFLDIHQRWQALGYPFDHLVPSLATAALSVFLARPTTRAICEFDIPSDRRKRRISAQSSTSNTRFLPCSVGARVSGKLVNFQLPRADQYSVAVDTRAPGRSAPHSQPSVFHIADLRSRLTGNGKPRCAVSRRRLGSGPRAMHYVID